MMDDRNHPFDEEYVMRASEQFAPYTELDLALEVIDSEMDWLRREIPQLAESKRDGHELVKEDDEVKLYKISHMKWKNIIDALMGPMYTEETFTNRIPGAVQRVHYGRADYMTGDFGNNNALILSKKPNG